MLSIATGLVTGDSRTPTYDSKVVSGVPGPSQLLVILQQSCDFEV